ncbi:hypothetical protein DL96DRAFT_1615619 [Flagelloscypha sp. PMI_526]|nr:hypothetical protein DL96DRAFT_1615619 [Flagelloscypha sp. PMI_526]
MATSTLFKIDDSSPLIRYDPVGQWLDGDPVQDPAASRYFGNNTFRLTVGFGASASFDFNGTAITIGGAKRGNHGPYQVLLDDQSSKFNGSVNPDIFQTPLFEATGLTQGLHNIKIINQPEDTNFAFLDIDFIEWHSDVQGTQSRTIEDGDSSFKYTPASAWTTDTSSAPGYSSGNGHFTTTDKASVTFNFQGDAVQLIGSIGPDHGVFTASLDGQSTSLNATHGTYQPQQMLYFADGLGSGQHTLTVTRVSGKLGIDCATVIDFNGKQPQYGFSVILRESFFLIVVF